MSSRWNRFTASVERCNVLVSWRRWHLIELTDQWFCPSFLRESNQEMLTKQWSTRMPWLQTQSPAELVSSILSPVLSDIQREYKSKTELTVVDFCSGSGGPVPSIERLVNKRRAVRGLPAVPFLVSDLYPDIDAYMEICSVSSNLSFVPQPVDATRPPVSCLNEKTTTEKGTTRSTNRVFWTFNLAFHHFDDEQAVKILASGLEHSDGFAIFELQDRRLSSLLLMLAEFVLLFLCTIFWFPRRRAHLIFTYLIPIMPWLQMIDGSVSCLRTRTFEEVLDLVDVAVGDATLASVRAKRTAITFDGGNSARSVMRHGWVFEGGRKPHTWPLGHLNYIVARRAPLSHLKSASLRSARRNAKHS